MILRLAEVASIRATALPQFLHLKLESASLCTGVEDDRSQLKVENNVLSLEFGLFQLNNCQNCAEVVLSRRFMDSKRQYQSEG